MQNKNKKGGKSMKKDLFNRSIFSDDEYLVEDEVEEEFEDEVEEEFEDEVEEEFEDEVEEEFKDEVEEEFEEDPEDNETGNNNISPTIVIDDEEFEESRSSGTTRSTSGKGEMSVIKSSKNGKRVVLSRRIYDRLDNPEYVKVIFSNKSVAFKPVPEDCLKKFAIREYGNKGIIYCGSLVEEIARRFSLDYCDRVSITFPSVKFTDEEGETIAVVRILD